MGSVCCFFYELDENIEAGEWEELGNLGLVKPDELVCLEDMHIRSSETLRKSAMLLHWAEDVASAGHALAVKDSNAPPNMRSQILAHTRRCGKLQSEIANTMSLPIPYAYFHLLN